MWRPHIQRASCCKIVTAPALLNATEPSLPAPYKAGIPSKQCQVSTPACGVGWCTQEESLSTHAMRCWEVRAACLPKRSADTPSANTLQSPQRCYHRVSAPSRAAPPPSLHTNHSRARHRSTQQQHIQSKGHTSASPVAGRQQQSRRSTQVAQQYTVRSHHSSPDVKTLRLTAARHTHTYPMHLCTHTPGAQCPQPTTSPHTPEAPR